MLGDYLSLLKPRVVLLLVLTALGAMLPAAHGHPSIDAVIAVLLGGTLAAGGASAINCWFDRDIDATMKRMRQRPIPTGRIPAWHALALGVTLNAGAFLLLLRLTSWTAFSLFLVILFWTPPHFWALAQMIRNDYESAGVPMLPVVAGERSTRLQSLLYAVLTFAVSLVPFFSRAENALYLAGALVLGAGLVAVCVLDLTTGGWTCRVFGYSMIYLAGLFTLLAAGSL